MAFTAGITPQGKNKMLSLLAAISGLKLALFTSSAALDSTANPLAYSTTNELSSSGTGYTAGGYAVSGASVTYSGTTAQLTFSAITTGSGTIASGSYEAMLYDPNNSNTAYGVFAVTISTGSSSGTMTISFPANALSLA